MNLTIEAVADCRPPSPPDTITVSGSVVLGHPGHVVRLLKSEAHDGRTYRLDIEVETLPGIWIQVLKTFPFAFHEKGIDGRAFDHVAVLSKGDQVAREKIQKLE